MKLKLFSKKVPSTEVYKIPGDLRKTSQQIKSILDNSDESWEWNVKPEKKYRDRSLKKSNVSDREPKGYNRNFYEVTIQK